MSWLIVCDVAAGQLDDVPEITADDILQGAVEWSAPVQVVQRRAVLDVDRRMQRLQLGQCDRLTAGRTGETIFEQQAWAIGRDERGTAGRVDPGPLQDVVYL